MKNINKTTLKDLAGKAAYQRGIDYFEHGHVGDLQIHGNTIKAEVEGNELYLVTLKHTAKLFEGSCDCPASEGFDFCKHCVATGLKYLQHLQLQENIKLSPNKDLIKTYLSSLDKSLLVEKLNELIGNDRDLLDEWTLKADLASGKLDFKTFKKRITQAIPYNRNYYRYAQVRNYFSRVDKMVDSLAELIDHFNPDDALKLIDYALNRINRALGTIDDSGGFRLNSVEILNELHIKTLADCHWETLKVADYLLKIFSDPVSDLYPAIPSSYISILKKQGQKHFFSNLETEWQKLPPLAEISQHEYDWETRGKYHHLQYPLLERARHNNDIDSEIALLSKTATRSHDMIAISRLCLEHERFDEAMEWFEQAQRQDRKEPHFYPNRDLSELNIALLCYQGKFDDALKKRWQEFEQRPSIEAYHELSELVEQVGDEQNWYQAALDYVNDNLDKLQQSGLDIKTEIYLYESQLDLALDMAQNHKIHPDILLKIIHANRTKTDEILPLYIRIAAFYVNQGKNRAYKEAIRLLQEAKSTIPSQDMEKLQLQIIDLRKQFKIKRNFVKWLDEAFPELVTPSNEMSSQKLL